MPHHTHTDTSSALALSGPARSAVQEELLAHVSGGLVNRVVILPLLFRLSPAFSSKSHGLPGGAGVTVFDWSERWESVSYWDTRPLKVTVTPPTPNVHPHCSPLTAHAYTQRKPSRRPEYKCCSVFNEVWNRIHIRLSSSILFIPDREHFRS